MPSQTHNMYAQICVDTYMLMFNIFITIFGEYWTFRFIIVFVYICDLLSNADTHAYTCIYAYACKHIYICILILSVRLRNGMQASKVIPTCQ